LERDGGGLSPSDPKSVPQWEVNLKTNYALI
jgi:hypothetical protein